MALRFSQSDLNVMFSNEGRDYNQHFQTYKFYFSMRMTFSNQGDSVVFVGDLLNLHGEALDLVFEQVFRACAQSVNLHHFNRNSISQDNFVQFTLEHTDFVDYVYSSRNVKFSELQFETLVGGVVNLLNNLAQSNRQMNIDNDWAISLQVSRTTEVPKGFGKDDGARVEADITENEPMSFFSRNSISVSVPRLHDDLDALPGDEDEEERLFGAVSEDGDCPNNDEDTISECGGEEYYDEDSGTLNVTLKNNVALEVLIEKEIDASTKIVHYCSRGNVFNSSLKDECLLIAIYVHHMHLTQPNNFKRIMSRDDGWLSPRIMDKLNDLVKCLENEFGQNVNGRGHWDEVALMRKLCARDIDNDRILKDRPPKLAISQIRRDNSSNRLGSYPTYILKHSVNNKNCCRIKKLFSHGDKGVFSNDKPCIL